MIIQPLEFNTWGLRKPFRMIVFLTWLQKRREVIAQLKFGNCKTEWYSFFVTWQRTVVKCNYGDFVGFMNLPLWWRHQMETFSALLALCEGNEPVTGGFPSQRPVTWSFDIFFDLCLNKQLGKHSRRGWFETLSHSLWRQCNVIVSSKAEVLIVRRRY